MKLIRFITDSTIRTSVGLVVLLMGFVGIAGAATITNWKVNNNPQMHLDVNVSPTMTSGIKIASPEKNGDPYSLPTLTGAMFRMRRGTFFEDMYASSGALASDGVITLYGIVRNVCGNYTNQIVSCGDGEQFYAGDIIETNLDARLINWKADTNNANTFTALQTFGSGVTVSGTTNVLKVSILTTAQRDALSSPSNGMIIYNSSVGGFQLRSAGSWINTGSGSIINASLIAAGKVQVSSTGANILGTATGSTTAYNALTAAYSTTKGGPTKKGYVPILSGVNGLLSGSLIATNAQSYTKSGAVVLVSRVTSGSYVLSAAQTFIPAAPIGSMMIWPTNTAPQGWVLCDGSAHTRTGTGAALFAIVGTTFGSGYDGTVFNVPDMRGRFPLGQDDMGGVSANRVTDTRADTIGSGSGSQVAGPHTHTVNANTAVTAGAGAQGHTSANEDTASPGTNPNVMNPYLTINYIIRAR